MSDSNLILPESWAWVIFFLPLLSALIITFFTRNHPRLSGWISISAVTASFLLSWLFFGLLQQTEVVQVPALTWLSVQELNVELGLLFDRLSLVMLLVVTGVGTLIHIFSVGYMKDDPSYSRYFASLSLFVFSMLGIVLANNFFMMFIFWELVGISSYLLIGFWFGKASAADACKKAFLTNRVGDFGFLLGIIILWTLVGSVQFDHLQQRLVATPTMLGSAAGLVGLLIFMGAMGKSAQFPLHVWLPDAMEGPTPVSALIHAATMVAAGVYMLCRVFFIFQVTPGWPTCLAFLGHISALDIIAWIGGFTALLAALMAVQQNDIKRILAYSTLSQLGYMVMSVGLAGTNAAMYHLTTHAFFKAMLFLGAGSVIHSVHHEQDIWKMGGLKEKMPTTFKTFVLGTLALCGLPPLSGFFSKDEILATAFHQNTLLFVLAVLVATLTTFYMFRLVIVAFFGHARSESAEHAHESPRIMTVPLIILAVLTVIAGFLGLDTFLNPSAHVSANIFDHIFAPFNHAPFAAVFGLGSILLGGTLAVGLYWQAQRDPLPDKMQCLARAMRDRFYLDEIYGFLIAITQGALSFLADAADRFLISGFLVRGLQGTTDIMGRALRLVQTGNLQNYAFVLAMSVAIVLFFVFRN